MFHLLSFFLDVLANVFSDTIVVPAKTCVTLFFVGVVVVFTRKIWMSFFALIPLVDSSHGLFPITTGNLFFYTYYTVKFGFVLLGNVRFYSTRESSALYYSGKFGFIELGKVRFCITQGKFGFVLLGNVRFYSTRESSALYYSGMFGFVLHVLGKVRFCITRESLVFWESSVLYYSGKLDFVLLGEVRFFRTRESPVLCCYYMLAKALIELIG